LHAAFIRRRRDHIAAMLLQVIDDASEIVARVVGRFSGVTT
jgi:hypothetical protein